MPPSEYKNIYKALRLRIENGALPPESALPSENELCLEFSVSRPTIRRALEMLNEELLIIRQPGVGSFVAPVRQQRRQPVIGVDIREINSNNFYYTPLLNSIKDCCVAHGAQLRILSQEECATASPEEISGLISIVAQHNDYTILNEQARRGIPVVLLNRFTDDYPNLSYLAVDYTADSARIVGHALDHGFRKVAYFGGTMISYSQVYPRRLEGWKQAFTDRSLPVPEELMFTDYESLFDIDAIGRFLLEKQPEVIFSATGEYMNQIYLAAMKFNLAIPDQLRLLCFDDLSDFPEWRNLPVCFVQMPLRQMGKMAVEHIVSYPIRQQQIREILPSRFIFTRELFL